MARTIYMVCSRFLCRTLGLPPAMLLMDIQEHQGRVVHHLVLLILPSVLYLVPALPDSLFNQDQVPYL